MTSIFEKQLKEIVKNLLSYEPEKIILYGSTARGEITDDSE